jgi:hydroxyethylthiazole kinase
MEQKSRETKPLIHCITNPIAMNQSANAVLSLGGRPIMAEHPLEVEEITSTAQALLLNLGNISDTRMSAMEKSIGVATGKNIPVVLDIVGVACSRLRRDFFEKLITKGRVTVIKGNYSEILAIYKKDYRSSGVDAQKSLTQDMVVQAALEVSGKYDTVILATGAVDLIACHGKVLTIEGGCDQLGTVTGTGCMLGAIIATFLAFDPSLSSIARACQFFKDCGSKARTSKGSGSFMVNLMDRLGEGDVLGSRGKDATCD